MSCKLMSFFMGLLFLCLVVACQGNTVQQFDSQQLLNCRAIQHVLGEVCVPANPQRLAVLSEVTLADALALGIQPKGASFISGYMPPYLASYISEIDFLGKSDQPNLEKILRFKPDLIVDIEPFGKSIFAQLSQIAPTALGRWVGLQSWREYFDFVATVLGKKQAAEQVWVDYYQRVKKIKTALGDRLKTIEVSSVYVCCGSITIDGKISFIGSILKDVGINHYFPNQNESERESTPLSEERLADINTDIIFVSTYDKDSEKLLFNWQQKPLWKKLKAVQQKHVYLVNYSTWQGGNPIAANAVLDDLLKYLLEDLKT